MRRITSLILMLSLCGCAHEFTRGRGDVGAFIIEKAVAFGGTPITTNGLPRISDSWRYSEDAQGVIIRMPSDRYAAVESFLRQSFGSPQLGSVDTTDGGMLGAYRLTPRGGGIQFTYDDEATQVIVLRPPAQRHQR